MPARPKLAEPILGVIPPDPPPDAAVDLAAIRELEQACQAAEEEWLAAKESAKAAKETFDVCVADLRSRIREAPPAMPLFEGGEGEDES